MHFHFIQSDRVICDKHREGVKSGDLIAFIDLLVTATIENKLFKEFCGYSEENNTPAEAAKIPEVLRTCFPLCCFLGDSVASKIKSEIPEKKPVPEIHKRGVPYHTVPKDSKIKESMEEAGWRFIIGVDQLTIAEAFTMGYKTPCHNNQEISIAALMYDDSTATRYEIWGRPKEGKSPK